MPTFGKQLMDFIDSVSFVAIGTYITPEGWQDYGPHRVWTPEAEAKINDFLRGHIAKSSKEELYAECFSGPRPE